jgi:hypothetical protein
MLRPLLEKKLANLGKENPDEAEKLERQANRE